MLGEQPTPQRTPHTHFEQLCAPHTTLQLVLLPCSYTNISCKPARTLITGENNPATATNSMQIFKISASFPRLVSQTATETDGKMKGLDFRVEGKKTKLVSSHSKLQLSEDSRKEGRNWVFSFLFSFFSFLLFQS